MNEYFIVANSFAAPFMSDTSETYVGGNSPREAMESFVRNYSHPMGLYAAKCYASADAYHKNEGHLVEYACNHELAMRDATKGRGAYSYLSHGVGDFEIDEQRYTVPNPKGGRII